MLTIHLLFSNQADDDEIHGSAGFDDELHRQTGTSFVGREDEEGNGTEESRYTIGGGFIPVPSTQDEDPNAKEEQERGEYVDPGMGGF